MRTFKTGLAVLAAILVADALGQTEYFVLIFTALVSVESTVYFSLSNGLSRFSANAFGALIALFMAYTGLPIIVTVPAAIILLILLNNRFVRQESIATAAAIMIIILLDKTISPEAILFIRLRDTLIGMMIGTAINGLIFPPKLNIQLHRAAKALSVETKAMIEQIYLYRVTEDLEEYRHKLAILNSAIQNVRHEIGVKKDLSDPELKKYGELLLLYQKIAIYSENLSLMDASTRVTRQNQTDLTRIFGHEDVIDEPWQEADITKEEVIYNYTLEKMISALRSLHIMEKALSLTDPQ